MELIRDQLVTIHVWALSLLAVGLIAALLIEQRTRRIPNYLTVALAIAGIALALVDRAWGLHLLGFLSGFVIGVVVWISGMISAGVVKLLAAVGAVTSPLFVVLVVVVSVPIGFVWWIFQRQPGASPSVAGKPSPPTTPQPFMHGSWLIAGSCVVVAGILGIVRLYG
jgi:prepilin signal peptidase PulO-like enzyme (type II secretory pathway)